MMILVHGNKDKEPVVSIVLEGSKVLSKCENTAKACALLMGLIYALNLQYPSKLKYTFEVFQKLFMELDGLKLSPKVRSLKNKLLAWHVSILWMFLGIYLPCWITYFALTFNLENCTLEKSCSLLHPKRSLCLTFPFTYVLVACTILMLYYNRVDNVGYPHLIKLLLWLNNFTFTNFRISFSGFWLV